MRRKVSVALLMWLFFCAGYCQQLNIPLSETISGPVEAELLKTLNVRHVAAGDTVYARVTRAWKGPGCNLRQGATLEGVIALAQPHKGRGESKLALSFTRAQCDGSDMKPINLLLSAVAHVPEEWADAPSGQMSVPVSFANPTSLGKGSNYPADRRTATGDSLNAFYSWHIELKGITHHFPMSAQVKPGDVIDIKGMSLELGTGPNQSSILAQKKTDIRLDQYTQILLVPSSLVFVRSEVPLRLPADAAALGGMSKMETIPVPAMNANDVEICAPPGCAVDLPVTSDQLQGTSEVSIATRPLGYAPRTAEIVSGFTEDEAVAWLGPGQLLFAFNAHRLISREGVANWNATHRIVRVVLIDTQSRSVIRAVDWETMDSKRFLWPLSGGRVLAHVGNELRVYGAGLEVLQRIPLAGPLEFIRMSPNREVMAVATLRERHSTELHAKLREELLVEPEEDVEVAILDKDFNTMVQTSTVSGIEPPTLLNAGQAMLFAQPDHRYRLGFSSWEGKSSTLARFASRCVPELSSVTPDLLFLVTCNMATDRFEYRVLRSDGRMVMHGEGNQFELDEEVSGTESTELFAIKAVHSGDEFTPGMDFRGADLDFAELRVYRASDGKRLLAVHVKEPTTSRGGYALSPDGSHLAVLTRSQIQLFDLPAAQ